MSFITGDHPYYSMEPVQKIRKAVAGTVIGGAIISGWGLYEAAKGIYGEVREGVEDVQEQVNDLKREAVSWLDVAQEPIKKFKSYHVSKHGKSGKVGKFRKIENSWATQKKFGHY